MDQNELNKFSKHCRFCLNELSGHERLNLGEIVREKFFEMTQFELSYSTKLSQFVCYNCFSILSRYSALKKGFIENQNVLNNLLKKTENPGINELYIKVEAIREHKGSSDCQGVIALRNSTIEDLYHVEEFEEKQGRKEDSSQNKSSFCDICHKWFNSQRTLKDHIDRIHLKIRKFKCSSCDYNSYSSYELTRHMVSNHQIQDPVPKKFLCDLCAVEFSKNSCLILHKKSHHLKITRYECDKCGHKTFKKENLVKHISTHLPSAQKILFKCSSCPAEVTSRYILKMHEKNLHQQHQKSYHCQYSGCDKAFSREGSLKEHQKFVHLKLRPINCQECHLAFSSNSHLNRHKKRKH